MSFGRVDGQDQARRRSFSEDVAAHRLISAAKQLLFLPAAATGTVAARYVVWLRVPVRKWGEERGKDDVE